MINVNDVPRISELFAAAFFYGFRFGYSVKSVEEKLLHSAYMETLENGDASFLNRESVEAMVGKIYETEDASIDTLQINSLSLWLGDLYTKIFFSFHKSFSFIFLYLPLEEAIRMFPLFHEMDFSQALHYFEERTYQASILKLLLRQRKMRPWELSILTGIKYNTVVSYVRDNAFIYQAKADSVYKISHILGVKFNVFMETIPNFTNSEMFEFDKTNPAYRSYLGLLFAAYDSVALAARHFEYHPDSNDFHSENQILKVLWTSIVSSPLEAETENKEIEAIVQGYVKDIPDAKRKDHFLIIFEYSQISRNPKPYQHLIERYGVEGILLINAENMLWISSKCSIIPISDTMNNALIKRAKELVGGDFAV